MRKTKIKNVVILCVIDEYDNIRNVTVKIQNKRRHFGKMSVCSMNLYIRTHRCACDTNYCNTRTCLVVK